MFYILSVQIRGFAQLHTASISIKILRTSFSVVEIQCCLWCGDWKGKGKDFPVAEGIYGERRYRVVNVTPWPIHPRGKDPRIH
jgi:hypothetical protein